MEKFFSQDEFFRYSRQFMIPEIGLEGQKKIKNASVLVVGAGGLGSLASQYLAAAGVGRIGIVDNDHVELSNLQRQTLYDMRSLGLPKAEQAKKRLLEINPAIQVDAFNSYLHADNAFEISEDFDILVDGSDNLPTRYLINDLCVLTRRPYIFGAVHQFEGQVALFDSRTGPCYRCVFGEPPSIEQISYSQDAGIIGILPGLVGLLQAAEVLKIILGLDISLAGKLVLVNVLDASLEHIKVNKDPECKICGENPQITSLIDYIAYCGVNYKNEPLDNEHLQEISPQELAERMKKGEKLKIIDIRNKVESQISSIPGVEQIPYLELTQSLENFDNEDEFILICRDGNKSTWAQRLMHKRNYKKVLVLKGGINAWVEQIDPKSPKY